MAVRLRRQRDPGLLSRLGPWPGSLTVLESVLMAGRIRVRKHEAIPDCGSFEVQVPGKGSTFFYWDDIAGRRLRPEMTREQALEAAKALARAERDQG